MEVAGVSQPGELATGRRWWNSSSRGTHLGGAESGTLGRDRGMGAEEDFLGRISRIGEMFWLEYMELRIWIKLSVSGVSIAGFGLKS